MFQKNTTVKIITWLFFKPHKNKIKSNENKKKDCKSKVRVSERFVIYFILQKLYATRLTKINLTFNRYCLHRLHLCDMSKTR
jgi:hypothetical protein